MHHIRISEPKWPRLANPVNSLPLRPRRGNLRPRAKFTATSAADRLEHYDHSALDDRFENELYFAGDDLAPFAAAHELAAAFSTIKPQAAAATASIGSSTNTFKPLVFEPDDESEAAEIITLSDNPTEEEMLAYAEQHPLIRKVKRAFRATVVEVRKAD